MKALELLVNCITCKGEFTVKDMFAVETDQGPRCTCSDCFDSAIDLGGNDNGNN